MSLFDTTQTFFAEILLPVPIPKVFTYRIPASLSSLPAIGQRAIVQFGDRKILTGIILSLHELPPKEYEAKYILELLDDNPIITPHQLKFFAWMADYYCCSQGEVLNAALPAGLKLSSESMVQLHPTFDWQETPFEFSQKEETLLRRLTQEPLRYSEISKILGTKSLYSILKSLTKKEAVVIFEEVKDRYKPKVEKRIRLNQAVLSEKKLEEVFDSLQTKPKQEEVLLRYLHHVPALQQPEANKKGIAKRNLLDESISESSLQTLIKNGVLEEFEIIVSRFDDDAHTVESPVLSSEQMIAEEFLLKNLETVDTALLQGVTGSGKTEIYIDLVRKTLEGGSQALLLLPEIALTTQIVKRLKRAFGNSLGIYHSRFSDNERVEVWNGVLTGRYKFVVGVRSSIFLPFDHLGLIIVDEEHDSSYKQQDPAPRYHARDSALMLAHFHHAKVVLGSATPSIESYFHAQQGRYAFVKLDSRYGNAPLPEVLLADLKSEQQRKINKGEFSSLLLTKIKETLDRHEQVIIFQNRRGYSPTVSCEDCGWVPKCTNCAVSLTYHQYRNALVCHYCGYKESMPSQCPTCTSARIKTIGYGTEKLEEELGLHFPDTQIQRMDLDTTRTKSSFETILDQFEKGETQILVGTQMVTKGLDFDNVSTVGIFNADRMLHFPDFRSFERAYQLMTQVSGRAGRRDKKGEVIIQTSQPDHPILDFVRSGDYTRFYEAELNERQQHNYPPFTRLVEITVKHKDSKTCRKASQQLADWLRQALADVRILGPGEPMVAKIRNQYLMSVLLKVQRGNPSLSSIKQKLIATIQHLNKQQEFRTVRVIVDVDPV
jgi:primosomal protein N' (replication factor Y) (superfamily II helicase)